MLLVQYLLWHKGCWTFFGRPRLENGQQAASLRVSKLAFHYGATRLVDFKILNLEE